MIEIRGIKIPVTGGKGKLERQIMKRLHLKAVPEYQILRRSIDARKKPDIFYVYHIGVILPDEGKIINKINDKNIMLTQRADYQFPEYGSEMIKHHPLIIGSGPAGLFCALMLAQAGYAPIIVERGHCVEERVAEVNGFFQGKPLNTECNVQFGEGGAGTFSDGKLNTQIKDKCGRLRYVLEKFVKHGAAEEILYDSKPHIGTDVLVKVVKGIREEIEVCGGRFLFDTKAADIRVEHGGITGVKLLHKGYATWVECSQVVFAIGHSARDTFSMLYNKGFSMQAKDFAMGVRIEHPAAWIQKAMYGEGTVAAGLPAAPYKVTHQAEDGRGVYSFCMCPGGYIVNASSEKEHIAVNGMSYSGRNGINSNSAIVVTIRQSDFDSDHPLAGIAFQRKLEHQIYKEGQGRVVVQRFGDFERKTGSKALGGITPQIKGEYILGNIAECLPDFMTNDIIEGIQAFEKFIPGFAHEDAVMSGVESRTSSPVRIHRDGNFLSNIKGGYPCGEGAGYAGGIMSAAMDGMKTAEAIIRQYRPIGNGTDRNCFMEQV